MTTKEWKGWIHKTLIALKSEVGISDERYNTFVSCIKAGRLTPTHVKHLEREANECNNPRFKLPLAVYRNFQGNYFLAVAKPPQWVKAACYYLEAVLLGAPMDIVSWAKREWAVRLLQKLKEKQDTTLK